MWGATHYAPAPASPERQTQDNQPKGSTACLPVATSRKCFSKMPRCQAAKKNVGSPHFLNFKSQCLSHDCCSTTRGLLGHANAPGLEIRLESWFLYLTKSWAEQGCGSPGHHRSIRIIRMPCSLCWIFFFLFFFFFFILPILFYF